MRDGLRQFADSFAPLGTHNRHRLDNLYSQDISFTDPLHQVRGISARCYEYLLVVGRPVRWLKGRMA
ncbi:hypothetical protein SAMN04490207_2622 [Pseudomonas gessardii]|uniref:AraC family transcriptional regulator n=1 Tax=Pseudomonas gessardii TaxID=78544 RepID=A0ABS9F314_9PSED|nr:hypothetical protein [Pseudomonas gessardii]MCF4977708.1 hypothetical protein [Pseudomonas gessardii]MCF4991035.1 hypothetical protein [Pseudomonas gessardii]MCF5084184.1 hypothetical protein [Pseudomonas gessardii]MCF5095894.1 hypothetical protein [Pseudomonas gessardii]MCF5105918.1 hypothetical protein [Pseudomonas gessardii]